MDFVVLGAGRFGVGALVFELEEQTANIRERGDLACGRVTEKS